MSTTASGDLSLGPLTTTFKAPSSCSSQTGIYYNGIYFVQGPTDLEHCYPTNFAATPSILDQQYYEPGNYCPFGYSTATTYFSTITICCPSTVAIDGYTWSYRFYDDRSKNPESDFGCSIDFTSDVTITATLFSTDNDGDLTTIAFNSGTGGLNAYSIQLHSASASSSTTSSSTSKSTTAHTTSSAPAATTTGTGGSGGNGLSAGAAAGIAVGAIAAVAAVVGAAVWMFMKKRREKRQQLDSNSPDSSTGGPGESHPLDPKPPYYGGDGYPENTTRPIEMMGDMSGPVEVGGEAKPISEMEGSRPAPVEMPGSYEWGSQR